MTVMLANNTGVRTGYLAGRFPGKIGHLFSPGAQRGPFEFVPYCLDNGRFGAGADWSEAEWLKLLDWARSSGQRPGWVLVPDVVGDRLQTLRSWDRYVTTVRGYGWPLAFAVQDGMMPGDVPDEAQIVFVGGTTEWKLRTVGMWCGAFDRVHVGRVNSYRRLWQCHDAGAESTDGSGWHRSNHGSKAAWRALTAYLMESTGSKVRQEQMELADCNFDGPDTCIAAGGRK